MIYVMDKIQMRLNTIWVEKNKNKSLKKWLKTNLYKYISLTAILVCFYTDNSCTFNIGLSLMQFKNYYKQNINSNTLKSLFICIPTYFWCVIRILNLQLKQYPTTSAPITSSPIISPSITFNHLFFFHRT